LELITSLVGITDGTKLTAGCSSTLGFRLFEIMVGNEVGDTDEADTFDGCVDGSIDGVNELAFTSIDEGSIVELSVDAKLGSIDDANHSSLGFVVKSKDGNNSFVGSVVGKQLGITAGGFDVRLDGVSSVIMDGCKTG
jgi:hypothetical protein